MSHIMDELMYLRLEKDRLVKEMHTGNKMRLKGIDNTPKDSSYVIRSIVLFHFHV